MNKSKLKKVLWIVAIMLGAIIAYTKVDAVKENVDKLLKKIGLMK